MLYITDVASLSVYKDNSLDANTSVTTGFIICMLEKDLVMVHNMVALFP